MEDAVQAFVFFPLHPTWNLPSAFIGGHPTDNFPGLHYRRNFKAGRINVNDIASLAEALRFENRAQVDYLLGVCYT
jgi:hypothetical protein